MNKNTVASLGYACTAVNSLSLLKYLFGFYRRNITYGWAFDLTFGLECFFNLLSDYFLIAVVNKNLPMPICLADKPIRVLHGILAWNAASISLCYGTSVALATHFSSTVDLKDSMQQLQDQHVEEKDFRRQMLISSLLVFTVVTAVKGGILYGLYGFYNQMQSTGGSIEEAPTAFYFPADPNAPIPFAPRTSRSLTGPRVPLHHGSPPPHPTFPPPYNEMATGRPPFVVLQGPRQQNTLENEYRQQRHEQLQREHPQGHQQGQLQLGSDVRLRPQTSRGPAIQMSSASAAK